VGYVWFGRGSSEGGIVPVIEKGGLNYQVCRMTTRGWFVIPFDWLCEKPPFDDEAVRRKILAMLNEIPGVHFEEDVLTKRARVPFGQLVDRRASEQLKATIAWMIRQIRDL
jgi:hypothetical protein